MPLSPTQRRLAELIVHKGLNGSMSTTELAWRANTSRLAVWSAMRSLEAKKLAGYFRHGNDQWAASHWWVADTLKRHIDQAELSRPVGDGSQQKEQPNENKH